MLRYIAGYLATGLAFVLADAVWLTVAGPRLYRPVIGPLLADKVAVGPALAFYLVYVSGVLLLAVAPAAREGVWSKALINGAILGVVAYATYDLTNQATLRLWSTRITLADMAWGAFATALAATLGFFAWRAVQRAFG